MYQLFLKKDDPYRSKINIVHELSQAIDKGKEVRMIILDVSMLAEKGSKILHSGAQRDNGNYGIAYMLTGLEQIYFCF